MCGIFGVINHTGKYITGIYGAIPDFCQVGAIRGVDGTGLMKVDDRNNVFWCKSSVAGYNFINLKNVRDFLTGIGDVPFVVGHNRWATKGVVNDDNSHPFEYKHICLVHNGTVAKTKELAGKHKLDVDSAMVAHSIADNGLQDTMNEMYGAYSMVWHNSEDRTLNFLRNHERPMGFIRTKQGAIVFCSETDMGVWLLRRRGFEIINVEQAEEDTLYSFHVGEKEPEKSIVRPIRKVIYTVPKTWPSGKHKTNVIPLDEKLRLRRLAGNYNIGEPFQFSLVDFNGEVRQGGFINLWGEQPGMDDVKCQGNYSGNVDALWNTKNLLTGIITAIHTPRSEPKVVLHLKDIKISEIPDPFFKPEEKDEKKFGIPPEDEKKISTKKSPKLSTKCCMDCGHIFTRANCDDPYLVTRNGESKIVCVSCYMDAPETDGNRPGIRV